MLVAGEDGDGVNALFPSVLHGTVWKSLEKGCHEEKGPARHRDDFPLLCSSPALEDRICYPHSKEWCF